MGFKARKRRSVAVPERSPMWEWDELLFMDGSAGQYWQLVYAEYCCQVYWQDWTWVCKVRGSGVDVFQPAASKESAMRLAEELAHGFHLAAREAMAAIAGNVVLESN